MNDLNYLGTFDVIDEVYAVYPSGGVTGNYVIVDGVVLYWDESVMMWVSRGEGSSAISALSAAVVALQGAVSALQTAVAGKAGLDTDGRVKSSQATRMTLLWMGASIDGAIPASRRIGELVYNEDSHKIERITNTTQWATEPLGEPDPAIVYCSQQSGKMYRWDIRANGWERVANDVTDALDSDDEESALSAAKGKQLSESITLLSASVSALEMQVDGSVIGDRAKLRVVINNMDYHPSSSDPGTIVTPTPGGGYSTDTGYASFPTFSGEEYLCYAPDTGNNRLYYFYKIMLANNVVETRCSIIDPDPMLIYWDASDPANERVMRWDAENKTWVYNTVYNSITAINAALAGKANIADVYSKEDIIDALEAAADAEDISAAVAELDPDNQYHNGGELQPGENDT